MPRTQHRTERSPLVAISVQFEHYSEWITRCGGNCRLVQPKDDAPLDGIAGLLLTGGEDVGPERYGESNRHSCRVNPERDDFELKLVQDAMSKDIPILAVCRGMQLLVVSLEGTLYQDLPREMVPASPGAKAVAHRGPGHSDTTHRIKVNSGTLLARITGRKSFVVNSHHHQGVRKVPKQLSICARSPDGLVEAVENGRRRFLLGVQWHPERWPHLSSIAIMKAFLAACAPTDRNTREPRISPAHYLLALERREP